ncbi:hypothetical protein JF535_16470 [Microbulbifer salipaludis]|uniref:Uncharacterized protein n=1 Tax=Microbulbifer salipaludis TaxID=187980 RepID=A0ABS3EAU3_9GAMM|nr:hypothetical protein [Microbulbifer salipaludis]MBN8432438.1 hypothetical protein [Microbulbifer salipaludis]
MQPTQCFTRSRYQALAFALLTALAGSVAAQVAGDSASEASDSGTNQAEASAQPVSVKTTEPAPKPVVKKTPTIKAQSAESADGYEASEEISEDLSVSYPVDI